MNLTRTLAACTVGLVSGLVALFATMAPGHAAPTPLTPVSSGSAPPSVAPPSVAPPSVASPLAPVPTELPESGPDSAVANAAPGELAPVWEHRAIQSRGLAITPFFRLLSYREGLIAGLTWIHGARTRALDTPDRRLASALQVTLPGADSKPRSVDLVMHGGADPGRVNIDLSHASGPAATLLRTLPADAASLALDAGADLALADLDGVARSFGLDPGKARRAVAETKLSAWSPGGLARLAEALAPLESDPSTVSPTALARAGYALAWQALVDVRVAPLTPPLRAAQALALASVAERLAGHSLPDAQAVRWLAPAAACGDYWLLARTEPPATHPELLALHDAYRDPQLPLTAPSPWGLSEVLSYTERAMALHNQPMFPRLLEWSRRPELAVVAAPYVASSLEFSVLARLQSAPVQTPLAEAVGAIPALGEDAPERLRALARAVASDRGAGVENAVQNGTIGALVIPLAVDLLDAAARTPSFAHRVLLEEAAERALHGLSAVAQVYEQFGLKDQCQQLGEHLSAHQGFLHPEVQWLLCNPALFGDGRITSDFPPLCVAASAAPLFPGLLSQLTASAVKSRLAPGLVREIMRRGLAAFHDHPGVVFTAATLALQSPEAGSGLGLLDWLARTQGPDRVPFYGLEGSPMVQDGLDANAPASWLTVPPLSLRLAWQRTMKGSIEAGLAVLRESSRLDPSNPALASSLIVLAFRAGHVAEAEAAALRCIKADPPGMGRARVCQQMAAQYRRLGKAEALSWALEAAKSQASWALTDLARTELAFGHAAEARAALKTAADQYTVVPGGPALSLLADIVASKGQSGWSELERSGIRLSLHEQADLAEIANLARVPLPATPFGKRLRLAEELVGLSRELTFRSVSFQTLEDLLNRADADTEDGRMLRRELPRFALSTLAAALRDASAEEVAAAAPVVNHCFEVVGGCTLDRIAFVIQWLRINAAAGRDLTGIMQLLSAGLPPEDGALAQALTATPRRLDEWLRACTGGRNALWGTRQYIQDLWIRGRDADVRELTRCLVVPPPPGVRLRAREMLPLLGFVTGSEALARKWLVSRGVPATEIDHWGAPGSAAAEITARDVLYLVRPDGRPANPLD